MQTKSLQLKRALSAALFVLLLCVAGTKIALAQNQVATLQHNDTITGVFYGQNAFVSAHSAAVNGDIITLSSGTFAAPSEIVKAITIHGAGCGFDSITQIMPTIISGDFSLRSGSSSTSFEGISLIGNIAGVSANNIVFVKCTINKILPTSGYYTSFNNYNWQFINCIIKDFVSYRSASGLSGTSYYYFLGMSIINSVVRFTSFNNLDAYNPTTINNSIVLFNNGQASNSNARAINNIVVYNSIITTVSGHTVSNCTFFNCISIETGETSLFEGQTAQNVMTVDGYDDVFETFDGTVTYDNIYQLKNDIATGFLGHDGTEVGIYGGVMPYKTRPNYMIMKNCTVAGRTNEDNKLSVEIELLGEGE